MATLIPNMQLSEIRSKTREQLSTLRTCEIYDGEIRDENYIYTHVSNNPYDSVVGTNIRTKAEYLGVMSNTIYPPAIETPAIKEESAAKKKYACSDCEASFDYAVALAGHKRVHRVAALV